MSDHDPQLDELVSAYLDGEISADDAARVEGDPVLRQRRDELAAARDAVRADVPRLDPADRDALLARVLAAVDADPPAETPIAPVTPLRRRDWFDPSRVLGIAAAVLAIVFLGAAITMLDGVGGGDDDASSSAPEAATMATDAAGGASAMETGPAAGPATDIGAADDEADLRALLDAALATVTDSDAAPSTKVEDETSAAAGTEAFGAEEGDAIAAEGALPCGPPADALVFYATLSGQAVVLHVQTVGAFDEVLVLDATSCAEVLRFTR